MVSIKLWFSISSLAVERDDKNVINSRNRNSVHDCDSVQKDANSGEPSS